MDAPLINETVKVPTDGNSAIKANNICQDCSLCCDGSLFSYVGITAHEVPSFKTNNIDLKEDKNGNFALHQSCPKLIDSQCSIYRTRPNKCSGYYCGLAKNVLNESISFEDAKSIIGQMKQRIDWLKNRIDTMFHPPQEKEVNLRDFLYIYYNKASEISAQKSLSGPDQDFIKQAFEYAKLVDRYFMKTKLLVKYTILVQKMQLKPAPSQDTNPHIKVITKVCG